MYYKVIMLCSLVQKKSQWRKYHCISSILAPQDILVWAILFKATVEPTGDQASMIKYRHVRLHVNASFSVLWEEDVRVHRARLRLT